MRESFALHTSKATPHVFKMGYKGNWEKIAFPGPLGNRYVVYEVTKDESLWNRFYSNFSCLFCI